MESTLESNDILGLLDNLASEPLSEDIRDLYNAAYEKVSSNPEKAIELGQRALITLDRLSSIPLGDSNALAYARGQCHLLVASAYLKFAQKENLKSAELHYLDSRDAFHSRQWSHLESLAYLGLAVARRKQKKLKEALITCKSAQDSVEHESIPSGIDTTDLRNAIKKERLQIQDLLLAQEFATDSIQIPVVSDIAAKLGLMTEEYIIGNLELREDERQDADFGLEMIDDSMIGQGIHPGDIALIRQQETVQNGEIAAIVIKPHGMEPIGVLRRYYVVHEKEKDTRHWLLEASQPSFEHIVVMPTGADIKSIQELYTKKIPRGEVKFFERAELYIAGIYIGSVSKKVKSSRRDPHSSDRRTSTPDDKTMYQHPRQ